MNDAGADPIEVADMIGRLLDSVPADDGDPVDRATRARLAGYAAGLRDGVAGVARTPEYTKGGPV